MLNNPITHLPSLMDDDPGLALPLHDTLSAVEKELALILSASDPSMNQAIQAVLSRPGKRLRPLLAILGAMASGTSLSHRVISAAAAAEALHLASLLHDDVIDGAMFRSHETTPNVALGNTPAVLLGDFFFARSLHAASLQNRRLLDQFFEVAEILVQGEFGQSIQAGGLPTLARYFDWIKAKTARLFALAASLGPSLDRGKTGYTQALSRYGTILGMCYQVRDDLQDLLLTAGETGKPAMADCRHGYYTLPVILAYAKEPMLLTLLREMEYPDQDSWRRKVIELLETTGGIAMTRTICRQLSWQAERKLAILPATPARHALSGLARWAGNTG